MASLIILYHHPDDPVEFERYYRGEHLPFAQRMPGVRDADLRRAVGTPEVGEPPYYRFESLTFDDVQAAEDAVASDDGRAVLADLPNFATGGVTMFIAGSDT